MNKKSILIITVITYMIGISSYLSAEDYYKKMNFGFYECDVSFGTIHKNVSEADMVALAIESKALGFNYNSGLKYGRLMVGKYPFGCKKDPSLTWPLYLLIRNYKKMVFGCNGCDTSFSELHENVSETDMIALANYAKAPGFVYNSDLKYGYLMTDDYPLGCESDPGLSWPVFLLINTELILEETREEAKQSCKNDPSSCGIDAGFYVIPVRKK